MRLCRSKKGSSSADRHASSAEKSSGSTPVGTPAPRSGFALGAPRVRGVACCGSDPLTAEGTRSSSFGDGCAVGIGSLGSCESGRSLAGCSSVTPATNRDASMWPTYSSERRVTTPLTWRERVGRGARGTQRQRTSSGRATHACRRTGCAQRDTKWSMGRGEAGDGGSVACATGSVTRSNRSLKVEECDA